MGQLVHSDHVCFLYPVTKSNLLQMTLGRLCPMTMVYFVPSDHGSFFTQRPWVIFVSGDYGFFFDPEHVLFLYPVTLDIFNQ